MSLWARLFAALYDRAMAASEQEGLADRRRELLAAAHGRVIEIGAGTGANLAHYPRAVRELVLVEPEQAMRARLRRRLGELPEGVSASVIEGRAERIALDDASFDCAVSTLALCTVADQARALGELSRLLRPGGRLLLIEHVRSEEERVRRWQDRLAGLWRLCGRGCHPNRDTLAAIRAAGFDVSEVRRGEVPRAPAIVRPMISGVAIASPG